MKKVMILGANNGQIPFMNICKKMGAEVITISIKGDYPGFKVADRYYYCDICIKGNLSAFSKYSPIQNFLFAMQQPKKQTRT